MSAIDWQSRGAANWTMSLSPFAGAKSVDSITANFGDFGGFEDEDNDCGVAAEPTFGEFYAPGKALRGTYSHLGDGASAVTEGVP